MQYARLIYNKKNLLTKSKIDHFDQNKINQEISKLDNGNTIKILSATDQNGNEYYIGKQNGSFVLVRCVDQFAKTAQISEEVFMEIMSIFYACRELAMTPIDESLQVIRLSRQLEYTVVAIIPQTRSIRS